MDDKTKPPVEIMGPDDDRERTRVSVITSGNGTAIASGIVGVVGFVLSWIPLLGIVLGDLLGALAIIMGLIGVVKRGPKGMAVLGILSGLVTVFLKGVPIIKWL